MPTTCFPHALQNELKFRTNYRRKMTQGKVQGVIFSSEMFLKIIRRLCLTRGRKRCGLSLSILRRLRVDEVLCWPRLSLSVCLSLCPPAYLRNLRVAKFFVHVTYVRGYVLLWRRCDKLCISGVMDDIIFAHNGPCDSAAPFFVVLCLWCDVALDC